MPADYLTWALRGFNSATAVKPWRTGAVTMF
jgi:hypothetical protein